MRGSSFRPRPHQTTHFGTHEPPLMPNQARRVSVDGEINEFYLRAILHIGDHPALGAPLHYADALHVHAKWTFAEILHPENIHLSKSDKALIDGGRVSNHGGSSLLVGLRTPTG